MFTARRKSSHMLRCCVPTQKTRSLYFWQALRINWFSSSVKRERLLAEDVFAGLEGLDGDLGVPMVGRVDAHNVDVFAIEDLR